MNLSAQNTGLTALTLGLTAFITERPQFKCCYAQCQYCNVNNTTLTLGLTAMTMNHIAQTLCLQHKLWVLQH